MLITTFLFYKFDPFFCRPIAHIPIPSNITGSSKMSIMSLSSFLFITGSGNENSTRSSFLRERKTPVLTGQSIYGFIILIALLSASVSNSKVIEFVCKRIGGSNSCQAQTCPAGENLYHKPYSKVRKRIWVRMLNQPRY